MCDWCNVNWEESLEEDEEIIEDCLTKPKKAVIDDVKMDSCLKKPKKNLIDEVDY